MGVRFFDKENMSSGDDYTRSANTNITTTTRATICNCNVCCQTRAANTATTTSAAETSTAATQTSGNDRDNSNNFNYQKSGILREIIGNCKEVRIEENSHNLRIVGNNNRIRISFNVGDITVIGNNTRLKIKINHGHIKYTGNDGRICLGKDSTEQLVDYSGCNGVLKVQNSKKNTHSQEGDVDDDEDAKNNTASMGTTFINGNFNTKNTTNNSKKPKQKYAFSDSEVFKCKTDYNNIFSRKKSLPNMTHSKPVFSENQKGNRGPQLPKSIVHNFGNIVIANSSNICITPQTYSY